MAVSGIVYEAERKMFVNENARIADIVWAWHVERSTPSAEYGTVKAECPTKFYVQDDQGQLIGVLTEFALLRAWTEGHKITEPIGNLKRYMK